MSYKTDFLCMFRRMLDYVHGSESEGYYINNEIAKKVLQSIVEYGANDEDNNRIHFMVTKPGETTNFTAYQIQSNRTREILKNLSFYITGKWTETIEDGATLEMENHWAFKVPLIYEPWNNGDAEARALYYNDIPNVIGKFTVPIPGSKEKALVVEFYQHNDCWQCFYFHITFTKEFLKGENDAE